MKRFTLTSDDGAVLLIDGHLVVSNESVHDPETRTGQAPLAAGVHEIEILYFDDCNDQLLDIKVQSPSKETVEPVIYLSGK